MFLVLEHLPRLPPRTVDCVADIEHSLVQHFSNAIQNWTTCLVVPVPLLCWFVGVGEYGTTFKDRSGRPKPFFYRRGARRHGTPTSFGSRHDHTRLVFLDPKNHHNLCFGRGYLPTIARAATKDIGASAPGPDRLHRRRRSCYKTRETRTFSKTTKV